VRALGLAVVVIAALGLPAGTPAAEQLASTATANAASFSDATGDAVASADVTTVAVSHDDLAVLTFQIVFAAKPADTLALSVYIDSDRNPATGNPALAGADYAVVLFDLSEVSQSFSLRRWSGQDFKEFFSSPPDVNLQGVVLTFGFDSFDLDKTTGFNFVVETSDENAALDRAPDAPQSPWSFELKVDPVQVTASRLTTKPEHPKAGRTFTASLPINASAPVNLGLVLIPSCTARAGTKRLPERNTEIDVFASRATLKCHWLVPRRTGGKILRGSVAVTFHGRRLTRSFSAKITP
jgi:hypothetical protein